MGNIVSSLYVFQGEYELAAARLLYFDPAVAVSFFHNEFYRFVDIHFPVRSGKRDEDRTSIYCDVSLCRNPDKGSFIFYFIKVKENTNGA